MDWQADDSWQSYERKVYELLRSTGHRCTQNATVKGIRAKHQIDVLVEPKDSVGSHLWLIECKLWSRRVAKRDVQSFLAVIADIGADHGYLLSEQGFQAGAIAMAQKMNVTLCNFAQLRDPIVGAQLRPDHWQSTEFKCSITVEEDLGNLDACAILELIATTCAIETNIIEIRVIREGISDWIISREQCQTLLTKDGTLRLLLPWDPLHLCQIPRPVRGRGQPFEFFDALNRPHSIHGPYKVVFRTLTGPICVYTDVPAYK